MRLSADAVRTFRAVTLACFAFAIAVTRDRSAIAEQESAQEPGTGASAAAPAPRRSQDLRGLVRPGRRASDPVRDFGNALLWPLRSTVDLLFMATSAAAGLLENEQIVPRTHDLFFTRSGELGVFPTIFAETGVNPNVGARMVAAAGPLATTLRFGWGGPNVNVAESRLQFSLTSAVPMVLSLEGFHDTRANLGYLGIGEFPESDGRNHFRSGPALGQFRERRSRMILGYGLRPLPDLELLISTSYTQRSDDSPSGAPGLPLSSVFEPGTVPGEGRETRIVYSELAARYDNRPGRRIVGSGVLAEAYAGLAQGVLWDESRFMRAGIRLGAFLPVIRRTTIVSAQFVLDTLSPLGGRLVPFRELTSQPSFRGINNRYDFDSAVLSLDYRWNIMPFVAGRIFFDVAKVFPSLGELSLAELRCAFGFGLDLHTKEAAIGRIGLAVSPDGFNFLLTLGVPAGFGDRQHRD